MLNNVNDKTRFGIPSKGRMQGETMEFFEECGFKIKRKNRQYLADLVGFDNVLMVLQNQEDIVRGVIAGNLAFGIVGYDVLLEMADGDKNFIVVHDDLEFGKCSLEIAVPENWSENTLEELQNYKNIRIASKFPNLTKKFLKNILQNYELVKAKGAIEVSPALGMSDVIVDLVSTGQTLADNRLKRLDNGRLLSSQAVFIGNKQLLRNPATLELAQTFLEYFEARIRGKNFVSVFINVRGENEQIIADKMFALPELAGLQGPTISPVISKLPGKWFAVHIIVAKKKLPKAIKSLRSIGGSGLVVTPTSYIFEEEPIQLKKLIDQLEVSS